MNEKQNIFSDPGGNIDPEKAYKGFLKEAIGSRERRGKALSLASMGDSLLAELFQAQDEMITLEKRIGELKGTLKKLGFVFKNNAWGNESIDNALALDPELVREREAAHRENMIAQGYVWDNKQMGFVESEELKKKRERIYESAYTLMKSKMDRV